MRLFLALKWRSGRVQIYRGVKQHSVREFVGKTFSFLYTDMNGNQELEKVDAKFYINYQLYAKYKLVNG